MTSFEIFFINNVLLSEPGAYSIGLELYSKFIDFAASEGYKGDGFIYGLVRDELEKTSKPTVKLCHALRTFDMVEVAYSFQSQRIEIDGMNWFGGYLHTLCVTRRDDIETQPGTLLVSNAGDMMVIDWLEPTVFERGCDREEIISQTVSPAAKAVGVSKEMLHILAESALEIVFDPEPELRKCHIAKSAIEGICEKYSEMNGKSRYHLAVACSKYAMSLDYSAAIKYFQTAGRIIRMKGF